MSLFKCGMVFLVCVFFCLLLVRIVNVIRLSPKLDAVDGVASNVNEKAKVVFAQK